MIHVEVEVNVSKSQQEVWDKLTNWKSHGKWIPFTKIIILEEGENGNGVGTRFIGRTGLGKISFDDSMLVHRFVAPEESKEDGKCWISKSSDHIQGSAYFHVIKVDENTSRINWVENITLPSVRIPRIGYMILSKVGSLLFLYSLKKFERLLKAERL